MILALLSDVHANLEALLSCLAHAHARGAGRYAFLGDHVGYGADPTAVLEIVAGYAARGAVVLKGNHDEAMAGAGGWFNEAAAQALDWTRAQLSPGEQVFLESLPLVVREEGTCFVHASAVMPARWDYVDSADAAGRSARAAGRPWTFSGHVHHQMLYGEDAKQRMVAFRPPAGVPVPIAPHRSWLAIVGSVGQPRDGDPAAAYALADFDAKSITFHRVPYDNLSAARKVRAAGLSEALAFRLERGV
jgi:diadenosine tetraphosphatase ApaH/serine/threonine PP2A family protein phosphatase